MAGGRLARELAAAKGPGRPLGCRTSRLISSGPDLTFLVSISTWVVTGKWVSAAIGDLAPTHPVTIWGTHERRVCPSQMSLGLSQCVSLHLSNSTPLQFRPHISSFSIPDFPFLQASGRYPWHAKG